MISLTPFLLFEGDCAEAMEFYRSCLGGELSVTRVSEVPMPQPPAPSTRDKVAYAHLKSATVEFSATDWLHPTRRPQQGNTVAMYVSGGTYAELKEIFERLAEGGDRDLRDELQDLSFGIYGHLADRYGVHWFFRGDKAPENR